MTGTFVPAQAIHAGRLDLGLYSGPQRCQQFTEWQTRGQVTCAPFCASALSMWLHEAGYRFDGAEHVWGDRGDWNVTAFRVWAQSKGLWRSRSSQAKPSWGVVLNFGIVDQHIGMVAAQGAPLQPVATIEGNTNGGRVLARTRYMNNVQGFIAFDEAGQTAAGPPLTPQEIKMGMAAGCIVPGARMQTGGPHKGRYPSVDAFLNADGKWDIRGANGVVLVEQDVSAFGVSIHHLGKLNKPIRAIDPVRDKDGAWAADKAIVAMADDLGTFAVHVQKINYG